MLNIGTASITRILGCWSWCWCELWTSWDPSSKSCGKVDCWLRIPGYGKYIQTIHWVLHISGSCGIYEPSTSKRTTWTGTPTKLLQSTPRTKGHVTSFHPPLFVPWFRKRSPDRNPWNIMKLLLPGDWSRDLFGIFIMSVYDLVQGLSDLQLGDQKVTLNHLVGPVCFGTWT